MLERVLADLVVAAHLGFIAFVALGGLLALRWRWAPVVHLPAALWGFYVEIAGAVCPLTPLENALRRAAGVSGYSGGFIEHYLVPLIYPASLTAPLQRSLAASVVLLNLAVYLIVWRLRKSSRRGPPA